MVWADIEWGRGRGPLFGGGLERVEGVNGVGELTGDAT